MSWLIQEKMFTYFYNKFGPVNRMHYMKCGLNSSLHNSGCCRRCVAPWIKFFHDSQSSQRGSFTISLLCDIPRNKAPRAGQHHVWWTYTLCAFFGCEKKTDCSALELRISVASICYGDSWVVKHFLCPHWVFQPIWECDSLGSFHLPQSNSSPERAGNLGGYIWPHMKITISNCWVLLDPEDGKTISWPTWRCIDGIAVGYMIRSVNVTHVLVVPFQDVRFHGAVAVTEISFCWWWVHISM